jgi:hypothetical protein
MAAAPAGCWVSEPAAAAGGLYEHAGAVAAVVAVAPPLTDEQRVVLRALLHLDRRKSG